MKSDTHKCGSDPAPGRSTIKTTYKGDYHGNGRRKDNR